LRIFKYRVLRRMLGPTREEVAGGWRRLHYEEVHNWYTSIIIIRVIKSRKMRWAVHVACMGEMRNAYKVLVAKSELKTQFGRLGRRRKSNIRMDFREIGWEGVEWIHLAQDREQWRPL
jgi:hypothetical protein